MIVLMIIDKPSNGWWLKRFIWIKLITVKNASTVNILQLLECGIIIQIMPFNDIMNVMIKRVFWSYHSVEKNVKSISKGPFLSHFLYFSILLQTIYRMSNTNNFLLFRYRGLWWNLYYNVVIFQYLTFCQIILVNKFLFFGKLLHYPIFLLS